MNVLAGLFIGWLNDDWFVRLSAPFAWGIVRTLYLLARNAHTKLVETRTPSFGLTKTQAFYYVEIMTAISTCRAYEYLDGTERDA